MRREAPRRGLKVLILHSDVGPGAPADELDTLRQAGSISDALRARRHRVSLAPFKADRAALAMLIARERPDIVFNLVEAVWGRGSYAGLAVTMLAELGTRFTGTDAAAMGLAGDKLLAKRVFAAAGMPTPAWSMPPEWRGLDERRWIVKSVDEDSSLGLDDAAVVLGRDAVIARAEECARAFGGRWFAEEYVEGREFNVAVLEEEGVPRALPVAEMAFENWDDERPRIMGATAKWDEASPEFRRTVWKFGTVSPELQSRLSRLALQSFSLLGLSGYARADFRVDDSGTPFILEINPNPSLALNCGLVASAQQAGLSYAELIQTILLAARY
ncbi:MAG: D-alanine--D-alanine ligase family protein [Alphaproteobacteria bacterium]